MLLSTVFLYVFAFSGTQNQVERAIDDGFNVMPGIVISATLNLNANMAITHAEHEQPAADIFFAMMADNNPVAENVVLRTNEKQSRLQQPIKYFITSNGTPQFQLITLIINGDAIISQDDGTAVTEEVETIYKWPNYNWGQVDVEKANYYNIVKSARQLFLLNQAYLI